MPKQSPWLYPFKTPFRLKPNILRDISLEALLAICLFLSSLLFLYLLVHLIILQKENWVDLQAFLFLKPFLSPAHTRIAVAFTFFGTGTFLIPNYIVIAAYCIRKKRAQYARMVSTVVLSNLVLGWLLKEVFHRPRPLYPLIGGAGGYSFPSGHALGGFVFSLIVLYLIWQTQKKTLIKWIASLIMAAFGILIGLSRIYLHVHYATDVIGSLLITLIWCSGFYIFFRVIYINRTQGKDLLYYPDTNMVTENFNLRS